MNNNDENLKNISYECKICNRNFTSRKGLNSHTRVHSNDRIFECDVCKRIFTHVGITLHIKTVKYCQMRTINNEINIENQLFIDTNSQLMNENKLKSINEKELKSRNEEKLKSTNDKILEFELPSNFNCKTKLKTYTRKKKIKLEFNEPINKFPKNIKSKANEFLFIKCDENINIEPNVKSEDIFEHLNEYSSCSNDIEFEYIKIENFL